MIKLRRRRLSVTALFLVLGRSGDIAIDDLKRREATKGVVRERQLSEVYYR